MNIAFIIDYLGVTGGVQQVIHNISSRMSQIHRVHVISLLDQVPEEKRHPDITYTTICPGEIYARTIIPKSRGKLRRYFKEHQIDIALLEGHRTAFLGIFTKPLHKTKLIACDHGALCNQLDSKTAIRRRKWSSRFTDHLVTLTEQNKRDYIKIFGTKEEKITCIPNWIPDRFFAGVGEYDSSSKKIITVSRLSQEKGLDHLLAVAEKVLSACPDWTWDVFGDGELRESLEQEIAQKGLENRIFLKGEVDDIPERYQKYAMLALTSYREGLPLVLLEAQAKKLPLVSFDIDTGPREIIYHGENGYLVPPYDTDAMAQRMISLIKNPEQRRAFSDRAYLGIDRFREDQILTRWNRLFEELLA